MTPDSGDKPKVVAVIETIAGATASDSGHQIKVGLVSNDAIQADLIMSTDRAVDLIAALATTLGHATRKQTENPRMLYILPAARWEIKEIQDPEKLTIMFVLPGGGELCFQIDRAEGENMHEALGVLLGLVKPAPIPQSMKH